jgi:hypothetical protein
MFKYDDHIMGIQGHPEYSKDLLWHLIDRLIQKKFIMVCLFSCLIVVFYFLARSDWSQPLIWNEMVQIIL